MPKRYFHYTSGKGLFGILTSNTLQCTNMKFLNDPSENIYIDSLLEELFVENPSYRDVYNELYNPTIEDGLFPYNYFVASFSRKQDSLHMWNYYASGNGYNIEINLDSIKEINKKDFDLIEKQDVIYDIEEQKRLLIELLERYSEVFSDFLKEKQRHEDNDYLKDLDYGELLQIQIGFYSDIRKYRFHFKHMAYRHEEETRLIIGCDYREPNKKLKYKVTESGVIIEYVELNLNLTKNLKSITIHPAASELHLAGIKGYLLSKMNYFRNINIKKSTVPFRNI